MNLRFIASGHSDFFQPSISSILQSQGKFQVDTHHICEQFVLVD